ncbi:MAG: hypothetical protein JXR44_05040 [Thiotrichales bacterium]|nr:hypothetical protein [Thiotrichales bacterium]
MKKLITRVALALSLAAFQLPAQASADLDATMQKAQQLHKEAKAGGYAWKQKAMKKNYFDTYQDQYNEAKAKGEMDKAKQAAELAMKTAEGEMRQYKDAVKAGWDR